jgi:hypothetical protein
MGKDSVFTKEELENLGEPRAELIEESIDSNDKESAKKLTRQMHREFLFMHNLYRDWGTCRLNFHCKTLRRRGSRRSY